MLIVIRKKYLLFSLWVGLSLLLVLGIWRRSPESISVLSPAIHSSCTLVLDAGHGGEDGGAVSPDGFEESQINLSVSQKIRDLLRLCGQPVVMIREDDRSLDNGEASMRQRKSADLKKRVQIVNETDHATLLSIHQNSLPSSPVTHGAQVFWNPVEGAEDMATTVQEVLNCYINPGNEKQAKQIPSSVYLMKKITAPGILVECGFLSNRKETLQLQEENYQVKLAATITAGVLQSLAGEE